MSNPAPHLGLKIAVQRDPVVVNLTEVDAKLFSFLSLEDLTPVFVVEQLVLISALMMHFIGFSQGYLVPLINPMWMASV